MEKKLLVGSLLLIFLFSGYAIYSSMTDNTITFRPEHQIRHQKPLGKIPTDLTFAGEMVELKSPEHYQKIAREIKVNTTNNSSTRLLMRNVRIWLPTIAAIIKENGLPEDFKYVAVAESNLTNAVSHKGAAGFWQFTEATAIELGLEVNDEVDERYHAVKATKAACSYFKAAQKRFGSWTAAAASYNRGMNGLEKAFKNQKVNSYYELALNDETSRYLYRIAAIKDLILNPRKYGFRIRRSAPRHTKKIKVKESITNLHDFAKDHHTSVLEIKEYNPWILKNTLTIKDPKKTYIIYLPKN